MCGALASFLHTTRRVIEPFRATTEFAIHRNANGDAKGCILAASIEQNGNHAPNFEWLAFKLFDIVHCVVTGFNIGRGHDKWGPSVVQKGIVTELIITSLKLHIHVLWPKVDGRSNGAQFVEVALVPWLELWQVVVQHINDTWQGQIEQKFTQNTTVIWKDPPIYLTQELGQQPLFQLRDSVYIWETSVRTCKKPIICGGRVSAVGAEYLKQFFGCLRRTISAPRHESKRRFLFFHQRNHAWNSQNLL